MGCLRTFFDTLVSPWLAAGRTYEVPYRSGVTPHLMVSPSVLLLHLLANTGNKHKHLRAREEYLPVPNIKARVRVPAGRSVRAVALMRARESLPPAVRAGWLEVTVPQVLIHEAIKVEWS
jgi:hypothetical protein